MSFDLYFYTKKDQELTGKGIEQYLLDSGCVREDEFPQWTYSNERTGVYFVFEQQLKYDDPEDIEIWESFEQFDNTDYTFSLNFVRPNFFGLEAFNFVEELMADIGLFALNPQSRIDPDNPRKETAEQYYSDWSRANLQISSEHFDAFELVYFPLEKSNDYWRYNFHVDEMQNRLGDDYFVPSLILVTQAFTGTPITISTWTQHIPNVFPPADYFLLNRKRKKVFRSVEESGLISRERLEQIFGEFLEPFDFKDCRIIHPESAERAADVFNAVEFEADLDAFLGQGVARENITNAERSPIQKNLDE